MRRSSPFGWETKYIYIMFSNCNVFWKWVYFYTENNTWARVDMESLFELNTRKGIPCLEATMYDFIYHINTIALQWQEKPPSLINEIKRIDNRTLRWSEGSRWKTRWIMITNKATEYVTFGFSFHILVFFPL